MNVDVPVLSLTSTSEFTQPFLCTVVNLYQLATCSIFVFAIGFMGVKTDKLQMDKIRQVVCLIEFNRYRYRYRYRWGMEEDRCSKMIHGNSWSLFWHPSGRLHLC